MQPKLIYLAQRRPDMSREQFVTRWRQHAELGMSRPRWGNIKRYVHCDVLPAGVDIPGISNDYDGVGMIWHKSVKARADHRADISSQVEMERDEAQTFLKPVLDCCLLAVETNSFAAGGISSNVVKLFRFFACDSSRRKRPTSPIAEYCRQIARSSFDDSGWPIAHCMNVALPPQSEGHSAWGLAFDCIEELWFNNLDELVMFLDQYRDGPALLTANGDPIVARIELVTNEVVLHDVQV